MLRPWVEQLHIGLPGTLPSLTLGRTAIWQDEDLGQAAPNLAPALVTPVMASEAADRMGTYVAYEFDDDPRLLVVVWRRSAPRRAVARIMKRERLGLDYVDVVMAWELEHGPGWTVLLEYSGW